MKIRCGKMSKRKEKKQWIFVVKLQNQHEARAICTLSAQYSSNESRASRVTAQISRSRTQSSQGTALLHSESSAQQVRLFSARYATTYIQLYSYTLYYALSHFTISLPSLSTYLSISILSTFLSIIAVFML